ncbi:MAG: hypothetical protein AAFQ74_00135 [Cyanobacteria bacterium J06623_4]
MQSNSAQQHLTAHYKTTLGVFFVVSGALILVFSVWSALQGQFSPALGILGLVLFVFGFYCLHRPYFLLEPRQLTVYNLLGMATKRYTFESWDFVKADSRRIYIDENGITRKVPVAPWLVKPDDWMRVRKLL